jgi:murein DD-endopeptidase MepM/ murein hydrolase activator NlpD
MLVSSSWSNRKWEREGALYAQVAWPDGAPITQEFGDMFSGFPHRGRDAGVPVGTQQIVAPAPGTVVACNNDGSFGLIVCLDFHNGLFGLMAHNSQVLVSIGQEVDTGTVVAQSGTQVVALFVHFQTPLTNPPKTQA